MPTRRIFLAADSAPYAPAGWFVVPPDRAGAEVQRISRRADGEPGTTRIGGALLENRTQLPPRQESVAFRHRSLRVVPQRSQDSVVLRPPAAHRSSRHCPHDRVAIEGDEGGSGRRRTRTGRAHSSAAAASPSMIARQAWR
jgi:hypothetical protein